MHGEHPSNVVKEHAPRLEEYHNKVNEHEVLNMVFGDLGDNIDTIIQDPSVTPEGEDVFEVNVDTEFQENLQEAMTPLYPGCEGFTVLTFIIKLFNLKVNHGWCEKSFTELLQLLHMVLPLGNKTPYNTYRA